MRLTILTILSTILMVACGEPTPPSTTVIGIKPCNSAVEGYYKLGPNMLAVPNEALGGWVVTGQGRKLLTETPICSGTNNNPLSVSSLSITSHEVLNAHIESGSLNLPKGILFLRIAEIRTDYTPREQCKQAKTSEWPACRYYGRLPKYGLRYQFDFIAKDNFWGMPIRPDVYPYNYFIEEDWESLNKSVADFIAALIRDS